MFTATAGADTELSKRGGVETHDTKSRVGGGCGVCAVGFRPDTRKRGGGGGGGGAVRFRPDTKSGGLLRRRGGGTLYEGGGGGGGGGGAATPNLPTLYPPLYKVYMKTIWNGTLP